MKFSENWLRTWVNPAIKSEELAHLLTMAGLEVESLENVAPPFNNVVVAEVLEVVKHPNADRLNVCQVSIGEGQPLNIVCGAANVHVGVKVPCAQIGAVLPGNFKIKQAKVRSIESFGMLCSPVELGLAETSDGLWLLPDDAPVGKSLREYLDLEDKLFTIKLTPNRSDCSGISGLAREVAALTGSPLRPVAIATQAVTLSEKLPVKVEDDQACPLYCGRIIRGVNAAAVTPDWMLRRLERSGLRGINAVVDITNYVMLELGQPMHAFDLAKLSGEISIRYARADEVLTLLNDQEVKLNEDVLVISDDAGALALAGIMGGQGSGVKTDTRELFLESAFFHPDVIAGRARRFGLATDSSFRFERGVDFASTRHALERVTQLLLEICGGQAGDISEVQGELPGRTEIRLRRSRLIRVLGVELENDQIAALLKRLQFNFTTEDGEFNVMPPSFRFDLSIETDLIEEIARLYGYENIPALSPQAALTMLPDSESQRAMAHLQHILVVRDYQEIVSYAFLDEKIERDLCANESPVVLQNPIASNLSVMRSSLIGGLVGALSYNLKRKQSRVRLFETGACFDRSEDGYIQSQRLSVIAYGCGVPEQWGVADRNTDFFDVKADVEALFFPQMLRFVAEKHSALHPRRSAQIFCGDKMIGWIGELHPKWRQQYDMPQAAVWFEVELDALTKARVPRISELPKSLPVRRDIALLVEDSIDTQVLVDAMRQAEASYVIEVALFDVYRGKGVGNGKKGLAFRVLLQDTQKTLTDLEIEPSIELLVSAAQKHGAQLRI
jgi:phenylalanyl-tRNA synthetase beta chain